MLAIGIGIAENAGQEGFKSSNRHWKEYCLEEAGRLYQHLQRATGAQEQREDAYRGIVEAQSRRARSTGSGRVCGCGV
jgi:hypothetical protein